MISGFGASWTALDPSLARPQVTAQVFNARRDGATCAGERRGVLVYINAAAARVCSSRGPVSDNLLLSDTGSRGGRGGREALRSGAAFLST